MAEMTWYRDESHDMKRCASAMSISEVLAIVVLDENCVERSSLSK